MRKTWFAKIWHWVLELDLKDSFSVINDLFHIIISVYQSVFYFKLNCISLGNSDCFAKFDQILTECLLSIWIRFVIKLTLIRLIIWWWLNPTDVASLSEDRERELATGPHVSPGPRCCLGIWIVAVPRLVKLYPLAEVGGLVCLAVFVDFNLCNNLVMAESYVRRKPYFSSWCNLSRI